MPAGRPAPTDAADYGGVAGGGKGLGFAAGYRDWVGLLHAPLRVR